MSRYQIKSPVPGMFYRKPGPGEPAFKEVGDQVLEGDTIGLVEVMKTFHEIKANAAGQLSSFSVADSEPVMAGQLVAELD